MHQSDYIAGKVTYTVITKMKLKLGWKFLINPSFSKSNFFQSALKNFLLATWSSSRYVKGVFNLFLCARKKLCSYDKYFKIYSKKLTPSLTPLRVVNIQRNFNLILRDLTITIMQSTKQDLSPSNQIYFSKQVFVNNAKSPNIFMFTLICKKTNFDWK